MNFLQNCKNITANPTCDFETRAVQILWWYNKACKTGIQTHLCCGINQTIWVTFLPGISEEKVYNSWKSGFLSDTRVSHEIYEGGWQAWFVVWRCYKDETFCNRLNVVSRDCTKQKNSVTQLHYALKTTFFSRHKSARFSTFIPFLWNWRCTTSEVYPQLPITSIFLNFGAHWILQWRNQEH